jgi:hypothetical protein
MILHDGPKQPRYPLALIHPLGPLFRHLPLSLRRHLLFLRAIAAWGNFRNPRTFQEKTQWRIINDRRPLLAFTQDKLAAKEYLNGIAIDIGERISIPETYWVGTDVRELEALSDRLPPRWVLKPNHSAGRSVLVDTTAEPIDWARLRVLGEAWIERDEEEMAMGHWAYGQARHLLIAEERIGTGAGSPSDLKFACLDGVPQYFFWADRSDNRVRYAFFDREGEPFRFGDWRELQAGEALKAVLPPKAMRDTMARIIAVAAVPFDAIRVDFYHQDGVTWFGELTSYPASGLYAIDVANNERFGALWQLPNLSAPDPREAEWRALLTGTPKGTLQA